MPIEVNVQTLSKLVLTTGYYEPPLFSLDINDIESSLDYNINKQDTTQETENKQINPDMKKTYNMSNIVEFLEFYGYNDISEDEENEIRESLAKIIESDLEESIKESILNNLEEYFTLQDGKLKINKDQDQDLVKKLEDIYGNNVIICSI